MAVTSWTVTAVTRTAVMDVTEHPVTADTDVSPANDENPFERENEISNDTHEEEVNQMAEKKVTPKKPAAKSSKTSAKEAATRVSKGIQRKGVRKV